MRITALILASLFIAGCSNFTPAPPQEKEEPVSFLTGKPGGLKLSDLSDLNSNDDGGMPVNAILWRASLEIVSLLPIADVDTFGGTIISDWYSHPDSPNERIKLTIFVVGRELRSDSVSVRVHVQQRMADDWGEAVRDEALARQIENLILARARELRAESLAEVVD